MQNLAWFWSTSKFGGQLLWNGWRYSKSGTVAPLTTFFRGGQKLA